MIKITDYFQPLNLKMLAFFFGLFIFFDILGTFIGKKVFKLKVDGVSRILNWLLGFGFFVFVWFLLSMLVVPDPGRILISIGILMIPSLPLYIKDKEYLELIKEIWNLKVPILIIFPFLPAVFVKASLPPYYADEMAYHYISPLTLKLMTPIHYVGGLFSNVPRTLELFWILIFSLLKTYSVARLFHFMFLATSMLYCYSVLKKNFGFLIGLIFLLAFFSIPQDIVFNATLGYVDIGAMAFLTIGLISAIDFILNQNENSIVYAFLFWAMSLGTKYTAVSSFVVFALVFIILFAKFKKGEIKKIIAQAWLQVLLAFFVFGGYWYVKNFIAYGNPIYPLIFHCWGIVAKECPRTDLFLGDWTTKVNLHNIYPILVELVPKNQLLRLLVILAPLISLFGKNKKIKWLTVLLFVAVILEMIILKYQSGFYLRYHQHIQIYLLLGAVLVFANTYTNRLIKIFVKLTLLGLVVTSFFMYIYSVRYTNSTMDWNEINYAVGKTDIQGWLDYKFPRLRDFSRFCSNPPDGKFTHFEIFEPELVWSDMKYDDSYFLRVFETNCAYYSPDLFANVLGSQALQYAVDAKLKFWFASIYDCTSNEEANTPYPGLPKIMVLSRKLNNDFVCNSTQIGQHLYYFDYTKVKTK